MQDAKQSPRAQSRKVEEADAESFPASDPPAWTATRTGGPEGDAAKSARKEDGGGGGEARCEAIALYGCKDDAQRAADALLKAGFASVEIGPPRRAGVLSAGIGPVRHRSSAAPEPLLSAALGALAGGVIGVLGGAGSGRMLTLLGAGGVVGALAARRGSDGAAGMDWPRAGACLVRVKIESAEDERRILLVAERSGARGLHLRWRAA